MNLLDKLKAGLLYFDGGTGTSLQKAGLKPGELPDTWNILHPEVIVDLHYRYLKAGANIINACTFSANRLNFPGGGSGFSLEEIITAAVKNAKEAVSRAKADPAIAENDFYITLDLGPTGKLLKPLGDLDFEEAVDIFGEAVRIGAKCGVDLIAIETMSDSYEAKAAMLAAKENCRLPVFVTTVYDLSGKMLTGADPVSMVALLEGLGADAIGINCGLGPEQMKSIVPVLYEYASVPIVVNPNAGLPRVSKEGTVFDVSPQEFAETMAEIVSLGARVVGGCCGTTPEHIEALVKKTKGMRPLPIRKKRHTLVSSYTHAVQFGARPILIGERINPTGKARLKQALRENDISYVLSEGIAQQEKGADILDVNAGLPELDEPAVIETLVKELQSVLDLPLQIDTANAQAMERAMRIYNGKPMVNSVNGKQSSMEEIFPLVKKYGGVVVALTLDENGIPETAEGRLEIAEKIYKTAERYGIDRCDIVVDALSMPISANTASAKATLDTLGEIARRGGKTVLGVSNVSFGLPCREVLNAEFFTLAMQRGLSAAIINPGSEEMRKAYFSFCALYNLDAQCENFIAFASSLKAPSSAAEAAQPQDDNAALIRAITKGLSDKAAEVTRRLAENTDPLAIINGMLVPALDIVGKGFESGTVFLPQLLMSAEAAKASFEEINTHLRKNGQQREKKGKIILATVHGDIHDIGKNIVSALLENYGYDVRDLGKDVPPETIANAAIEEHIALVGLSALMTTTVPAMEATIALLKKEAPWCKVMVGGAVLNPEYAEMIKADAYCKDAMESVRYAEAVFSGR